MPVGIIGNTFNTVWNDRGRTLLISRTRNALVKLGYTVHNIRQLFEMMDEDNNGVLDLNEFCKLLKQMKMGLSDEHIIELFDDIDQDKSHAITPVEFVRAIFPKEYIVMYG